MHTKSVHQASTIICRYLWNFNILHFDHWFWRRTFWPLLYLNYFTLFLFAMMLFFCGESHLCRWCCHTRFSLDTQHIWIELCGWRHSSCLDERTFWLSWLCSVFLIAQSLSGFKIWNLAMVWWCSPFFQDWLDPLECFLSDGSTFLFANRYATLLIIVDSMEFVFLCTRKPLATDAHRFIVKKLSMCKLVTR